MLCYFLKKFAISLQRHRPSPKITWIGPKGEINYLNPDYTISPAGNILTIPVASPRFSGEYRCEVRNEAGLRNIRGQLSVKGENEFYY